MSISSIGSGFGMGGMMGMGGMGGMNGTSGSSLSTSLTDDQKKTVSDLLSKYSSDSLTSSDAQSIIQELQKDGIGPSKDLESAFKSAGYDLKKVGGMAAQGSQSSQGTSGTSGTGMMMMPPPPQFDTSSTSSSTSSNTLTDDQKSTVKSILDQYKDNKDNLSASDVKSIFKQLKDAGITPSQDLKDTMKSEGFDLDSMAKTAINSSSSGSENNFWATQNTSSSFNTSNLQTLKSILDQYDFSNITSDQEQSLYSQLSDSNLLQYTNYNQTGSYFNYGV